MSESERDGSREEIVQKQRRGLSMPSKSLFLHEEGKEWEQG